MPIDRTTVLSPFAAVVSVMGTDRMISTGMAAKQIAIPSDPTVIPRTNHVRDESRKTRKTYPNPVTSSPDTSVERAPKRRVIAAETGDITTIGAPPGTMARPAAVTPVPNPTPVVAGN